MSEDSTEITAAAPPLPPSSTELQSPVMCPISDTDLKSSSKADKQLKRTKSTLKRNTHHRSHSKTEIDTAAVAAEIHSHRQRSTSRHSHHHHHHRSGSSNSSSAIRTKRRSGEISSPLKPDSPVSIQPLTGDDTPVPPSDPSVVLQNVKRKQSKEAPSHVLSSCSASLSTLLTSSLTSSQASQGKTCKCDCVCPEIIVCCKKCKLPFPQESDVIEPHSHIGNSNSNSNSALLSLQKSTKDGENADGNEERFIESCKVRIAKMYETLGRISSVVYEVMRNFDFSNPANQPPVGVDTNSYLKRLTTNYMFAIKNVQAIAVSALVDAMKQEDENLKAESLHMLSIRKAAEKREHHVQELIDTERNFNEGLRLIQEVWKPEMASAGLLDKYADDVLFKTVPLVKKVSDDFLKSFEAVKKMPPKRQNIGKILCDDFDRFNAFKQNCLTQQDASNFIKKLSSKQSFKSFEAHVKENPQIKNLNFAEYIFSPAQRVTRYPLLIKDIVKVTDQRHPDYKNLVNLCEKFNELNKEINDANALQSSVEQFVALKIKLKWTHEPYDFIANKAIMHFSGKASWKMFGDDSKKPNSKGTFVVFTNKCILACAEKIRDIRELETLPIKAWNLVENDERPNDFVLRSTDPNDTRRFVIECSDYVSMMNYKRTFETCVSDSDRVFTTVSMFKDPSVLSNKVFRPKESSLKGKPQDETDYKLPSSDYNAGDGEAVHPRQSRSIRNPPKVGPSEVFLINSDINGFFGPPVFKETDISDDIHKICTTQPTTFKVLSATPILDLPELKKGQSARLNQTRHRHKLSVNLTGLVSDEQREDSPIFTVRRPDTAVKKSNGSEENELKPKSSKVGLFKKLASQTKEDDSDSDSDHSD